ncbi:GNAT family N-acetyltransferase [Altererythrobacter endophyticus]|uniref:GNAT family N-acetyltransferase n=2 Tax=Altericroceibacterium endophyticum TaxID=1808508 RepID=A0A6I4T5M9_9SPHN|nr:GNAT family N-acetyltransferase [Altericroceibacterium endophyticum]
MLPSAYLLRRAIPEVEDYLRLRRDSGLTPHSRAAAQIGLPNSFLSVSVLLDEDMVGMGRVIGDGGLFFQIVDIAVLPAHQGKGLGKAIMATLMDDLRSRITDRAYVSLIADGQAHELYTQYGFEPVAPRSIGMAQFLDPARG